MTTGHHRGQREARCTRSQRRSRRPGSDAGPEIEEVATPVREWMLQRAGAPRTATPCSSSPQGSAKRDSMPRAMVGERGRLISSDFSPAMLDAARRRGAERGVGNVDTA